MKRISMLILLTLLLAACGVQQTPVIDPEEPTPDLIGIVDGALTRVAISAQPGSGLEMLGLPFDQNNESAVGHMEIEVYKDGKLVTFDDDNVYDPKGSVSSFVLGEGDLDIQVPTATGYKFVVKGYLHQDGPLLAYGETNATVTHTTGRIQIFIHTLLGAAELKPTAPIHYIKPGQVLDLYLHVKTVAGEFEVPISDYSVIYQLANSMGSIIGESKLGLRIKVTSTPTSDNFTLGAILTGWQLGTSPAVQDLNISFSAPFLQEAGVWMDTEAPTVSVGNPGTLWTNGLFNRISGNANDNIGLDRVQVYEGPLLIGSSHSTEFSSNSVRRVFFGSGTNWWMGWTPPADGSYHLTVIAIDTSGNQTKTYITVTAATDTATPTVSFSHNPYTVSNNWVRGSMGDADSGIWKVELYARTAVYGSQYVLIGTSEGNGNISLNRSNGTWSYGLFFAPSNRVLRVIAYDRSGKEISAVSNYNR